MKSKVENEVAIAADAGEAIQEYLDTLNTLLLSRGVSNSFGIVSDTENMIVEILQQQKSATKLGSDVTMELIYRELGTPKAFVDEYLGGYETMRTADDSRKLTKRPVKWRKPNKIRITGFHPLKFIWKVFSFAYFSSPLVLMLLSLTTMLIGGTYFWYNDKWAVIMMVFYAIVIYGTIEMVTGITGNLPINKRNAEKYRDIIRGLIISNFIIMQALESWSRGGWYFPVVLDDTAIVLVPAIFLECIILIRDHMQGFYPLVPDFKPRIRFITPHYLLLIVPLFFSLSFNFYARNDDIFDTIMLFFPLLAGILVYIRKYPVSPRFWIVLASLQIIAPIFNSYGSMIMMVLPTFITTNWLRKRVKLNIRGLRKIREMYSNYYNSEK